MTVNKADTPKVWATLVTNISYLTGVLTLDYCLKKTQSKYPLLILYTDSLPSEGHAALDARGLQKRHVKHLLPANDKDFASDPRFFDCWTKLGVFSLIEYDRIVLLDSDMLVRRNMDELMDIELDPPQMGLTGTRVLAASHACICNPLKRDHYPEYWNPSNCAYTPQHGTPELAQISGPPAGGLGGLNSGLLVINPSMITYERFIKQLDSPKVSEYTFADQSLIADVIEDRWVPLPYLYNALKTLRWEGVHDAIWDDKKVKNVHYILSPKPWDELKIMKEQPGKVIEGQDPTALWWIEANEERVEEEKGKGLDDGF